MLSREGAATLLYVADWGPGIPPALRDRIFEPYVTSKTRGSGLGLSVCRRIAQDHGAEIGFGSPDVTGDSPPPATVFRVRFPDNIEGAQATRKRILVVDDEKVIRSVFRDLMAKECDIVEAETGEEAFSWIERQHFDLIVTDKNLPGMSGLDLARRARERDPGSKVILITGYPSVVTAQQATELGVLDYLLKPFDDIREVRDKLRQVLERGAAPSFKPSSPRVDVFEDDPANAKIIAEALSLVGLEANLLQGAKPPDGESPAGVVISWDFGPARGHEAVHLAKKASQGAPFVVLAEHLTMETALECLRGGAAACLPKLMTDVKAFSRELARALRTS